MGDHGVATRQSPRLGACRDALRDRSLRRVVVSFFAFVLVENVTWVATLVFAYRQGGATEVGVAGAVLLLPGVVVAPLAGYAGDRFDRVRVLACAYLSIAAGCAVTAALIAADPHPLAVYVAAGITATAVTFPRPGVGSLLPSIARTGEQLTAGNVCLELGRSAGLAAGPALGGLLLALASLHALFWVSAALMGAAAAAVVRLPTQRALTDDDLVTLGDVHHETLAGLRLLRREAAPRRVVTMLALTSIVVGFLDVAAVVVALEVLVEREDTVGWLSASAGVGALVGAGTTVLLVGRRRLASPLLASGALLAAPLLVFAASPSLVVALVAYAVCGMAVSLTEVSGQTLLQGTTPDDVLARVYGCLEGCRMAFLAFGSLLCSVLFVTVPDRAVFALVACGVLVVLALLAPGLLATDRSRTPVDGDLVALLRRTTIFAPLPPFAIEQIVSSLTAFHPTEGTVIYEQGATGDSMVIIGGGSVGVLRDGARIDRSTAGDYVGEVALLDDKPRNATVVAGAGCTLYVLPRDVFLEAVTGHPRSLQRARAGAARRQRVPDVPDVAE